MTRAYKEARRRGLLDAQVGRGTFVSETDDQSPRGRPVGRQNSTFDEPAAATGGGQPRCAHRARVPAIGATSSLSAFLDYQRPGGQPRGARQRRPLAARAQFPHAECRTPGAFIRAIRPFSSITVVFDVSGDVVLTEALTFPGMKAAAERLRLRLVAIPMDADGILPDAFNTACLQHKPKIVYLIPTLHNPTTATLGPERRQIFAEIVRKHGLLLIEDDAYGLLEAGVSPIANLMPGTHVPRQWDRRYIAPGLRVSITC